MWRFPKLSHFGKSVMKYACLHCWCFLGCPVASGLVEDCTRIISGMIKYVGLGSLASTLLAAALLTVSLSPLPILSLTGKWKLRSMASNSPTFAHKQVGDTDKEVRNLNWSAHCMQYVTPIVVIAMTLEAGPDAGLPVAIFINGHY